VYALAYDRRIEKDLRPVPESLREHILEKIKKLTIEPRGAQVEKLTGINGYRLRVGNYRVLFTINDSARLVTVYRILHRREAYR
jgi:mRNA interferase RelE/StbE